MTKRKKPTLSKSEKARMPYRSCVGIMVFNAAGQVFMGRRAGVGDDGNPWQMPQGGIDAGESPKHAAQRELLEETSIKNVTRLAEGSRWLSYDLPDDQIGIKLGGRFRGQRQRWFAVRFEGKDSDIDLDAAVDDEFVDWKWVDVSAVAALVVPFKRKVYEDVVLMFAHLANQSGGQ